MSTLHSTPVVVIVAGTAPPRWQVDAVQQLASVVGPERMTVVPWVHERRSAWPNALRNRWTTRHYQIPVLASTDLPRNIPLHRGPANTLPVLKGDARVICLVNDAAAMDLLPKDAWRIHGDGDHPGADARLRGGPVASLAFWDGTHVLAQASVHTAGHPPGALAEVLLAEAARWPADLLRGTLLRPVDQHGPDPIVPPAGSLSVLRSWWKRTWSSTPRSGRPSGAEEWNIGLLHQPVESLLTEGASMNVRWLPAPAAGSHRMKPSGYLDHEGRLTALYTRVDGRENKWSLARVRPKGDNILKRSRGLLDLSVPGDHAQVVTDSEGPAVVFGAHEGRATALYRTNPAGDALEAGPVILDRMLCSPTLFQHNGKWWLLGTDPEWPDAMLLLYHAPTMGGPFTPHARRPVKLDVASARPAGPVFTAQGRLWRPAVDASDPAHPSVVIMAVDELSTDQFQEHLHRKLPLFRSSFYPHGCRTIHGMGDVTLVDGLKRNDGRVPQRSPDRGRKRRSSRQKRS